MECKYSPKYFVIFTTIFCNIDIRLVQELKSRCSEFTKEALHNEFEFPTLYQQLRIAIGAEGSQRSHITLRAQPHAYGSEPWYDFVEVLVTEDRDNVSGVKAHYAAELVTFVDLTRKVQCIEDMDDEDEEDQRLFAGAEKDGSSMLALVKFYVNALTPEERGNDPSYKWKDLSNTHKSLPFALVREDPNQNAKYGLIDTEQIQQGLWVQSDFQDPTRYWVLKM